MSNPWFGVLLLFLIGGGFVSGLLFAIRPDLVEGRGDPLIRSFVLGYSLTFLALFVVFMIGCYMVASRIG